MPLLISLAIVAFLAMAGMVMMRLRAIEAGVHAGDAGEPLSTFFVPWSEHVKHKGTQGVHAALDAGVHAAHLASLSLAKYLYRFSQFVKGRRDLMREKRNGQNGSVPNLPE